MMPPYKFNDILKEIVTKVNQTLELPYLQIC